MATNHKSINEKVTIRATSVGVRVIQRLGQPNLDKSGELRRLIELGFAAELAGFSLDGTVLRHAGRVWDLQPDLQFGNTTHLGMAAPAASLPSAHVAAALPTPAAADDPAPARAMAVPAKVAAPASIPTSVSVFESESPGASPLLTNLRGLVGG